jgi:hypothetical protein
MGAYPMGNSCRFTPLFAGGHPHFAAVKSIHIPALLSRPYGISALALAWQKDGAATALLEFLDPERAWLSAIHALHFCVSLVPTALHEANF